MTTQRIRAMRLPNDAGGRTSHTALSITLAVRARLCGSGAPLQRCVFPRCAATVRVAALAPQRCALQRLRAAVRVAMPTLGRLQVRLRNSSRHWSIARAALAPRQLCIEVGHASPCYRDRKHAAYARLKTLANMHTHAHLALGPRRLRVRSAERCKHCSSAVCARVFACV